MLKVFLGFVVSVVVLLSSAYVPRLTDRAYAASAHVLITHIQAGGVGAATQEFIVLYNNSPDEVNVTGWCLTNKNGATIACLDPHTVDQQIYVPAYRHVVIVSNSLVVGPTPEAVTVAYAPLNQSNGSITGSSDTISLLDEMGMVIDLHTWTIPITAGMQHERRGVGDPVMYIDTDTADDWSMTVPGLLPSDETTISTAVVDMCPNIDGVQTVLPPGKKVSITGECIDHVTAPPVMSEIFPNAIGADGGKEFIELFNPNDEAVSLADYELLVGPHYENSYPFPGGATIEPHGYISFTNTDIPFTLLNSSSRVALSLRGEDIVSEMPAYVNPKDGQSWANIDGEWQYTNRPTPDAPNLGTENVDNKAVAILEPAQQPCASNQYRSPETNRCRLIASASANKVVTPCKEGEERNLETNRCRKIVAEAMATPCKTGQERNPDTNRCRTIVKMPSADYGVLGAETKSGGAWYVWAAVGGVLLLALGYAVWEWHDEMGKFFRKRYMSILRFARVRK